MHKKKTPTSDDDDSDSDYSDSDDDIIKIQLNSNIIEASYSQLCKYSDVIRKKRGIDDARQFLSRSLAKYGSEYGIEERSIVLFFRIVKGIEKVKIKVTDFWDLNTLSTLLAAKKLSDALKKFAQGHSKDVSFIACLAARRDSPRFSLFFAGIDEWCGFEADLDDLLMRDVEGCLSCEEFGELPIETVTRIIEGSERPFTSDALCVFVCERLDERFPLLKFIDIKSLSGEKIDLLYSYYASEKVPKRFFEPLRADFEYIKSLRGSQSREGGKFDRLIQENRALKKENRQLRARKSELLASLDSMHAKYDILHEERKNVTARLHASVETLLEENSRLKEENEQLKEQIKELVDRNNVVVRDINRQIREYNRINGKNMRRRNHCSSIILYLSKEVPELKDLNSSGILFLVL